MVQEYMYDAIDELNNASLEEYIQWFKNLNYYDEYVEQAITDAYIKDDKDVYRMYLTLQLHADKQLTKVSLESNKVD